MVAVVLVVRGGGFQRVCSVSISSSKPNVIGRAANRPNPRAPPPTAVGVLAQRVAHPRVTPHHRTAASYPRHRYTSPTPGSLLYVAASHHRSASRRSSVSRLQVPTPPAVGMLPPSMLAPSLFGLLASQLPPAATPTSTAGRALCRQLGFFFGHMLVRGVEMRTVAALLLLTTVRSFDMNLAGVYAGNSTVLLAKFNQENVTAWCTITNTSLEPAGFSVWLDDRVVWAAGSRVLTFETPRTGGTSPCPDLKEHAMPFTVAAISPGPDGQFLFIDAHGVVYRSPADLGNFTRVAQLGHVAPVAAAWDGRRMWVVPQNASQRQV